jgi:ankyrin repeat protein
VTPLAAAAFHDNEQALALVLARGADPKLADKTGKTPIMYAAALGFAPIVRRLLDAGIPVDARDGNELTALMWAAGHADNAGSADALATVALLIERGATIDAADNRGRTALMMAAELGDAAVVELLLQRGADRALRDRQGKTALDLTVSEAVRASLAGK